MASHWPYLAKHPGAATVIKQSLVYLWVEKKNLNIRFIKYLILLYQIIISFYKKMMKNNNNENAYYTYLLIGV